MPHHLNISPITFTLTSSTKWGRPFCCKLQDEEIVQLGRPASLHMVMFCYARMSAIITIRFAQHLIVTGGSWIFGLSVQRRGSNGCSSSSSSPFALDWPDGRCSFGLGDNFWNPPISLLEDS